MPPIVIDVTAVSQASPSLVTAALDETDALFRGTGVRFQWRRDASLHAALHVLITNESGPARDGATPLGWLEFDDGAPANDIHLSYANAVRFMEDSREVVGIVAQKTPAERDRLLSRAMGRALAHELAHYLLATKDHSPKGLLKGARTAQEFFAVDRSPFVIVPLERGQIAARLSREADIASR